jgi:membrane-bound metal-dependent hydrolase YbcI (DUF457 family)
MDVFTHGLIALAVARIVLPRGPLGAWAIVLIAGTIADLGELSSIFGPSAYFQWHRTFAYSLTVSLGIAALLTVAYLLLGRGPATLKPRVSAVVLFATALLASCLHLALDICQPDGAMLSWPFSARRIATDWLAGVDPWIIAILIAAILLPELLRLVSAEIGAKDKSPRGRLGATVGVVLVILYVGLRANLHAGVVGQIQERSYRGESARRAAAFAESASLFTWHGIVETSSALYQLTVNAAPGASFDPENAVALFKPESSPALNAARDSGAGKKFLTVARFPKATVEKTRDGFEVQIRDLAHTAGGETRREVAVLVRTDANGKLAYDALVWARDLQPR